MSCSDRGTYRLHDTTGADLGLVEHPAPNDELGDVVVLPSGREGLVPGYKPPAPIWVRRVRHGFERVAP